MPTCVLVGPRPPPVTGQSLSFTMLCDGFSERGLPFRVIDISPLDPERRDGSFSWRRVRTLMRPFLNGLPFLVRRDQILYLTIAQSWNGFLRDLVFISLAVAGGQRVVLHLKGGNYDGFYQQQSDGRRRLIRATLSKATRIVVLGECLRPMFSFLPHHQEQVVVVYNGLPARTPQLPPHPKTLPTSGDTPVRILYLSNLIETKGYLDVLEAVRLLVQDDRVNVECHFCGDFALAADSTRFSSIGEAERDFFKRVDRYGLAKRVFWKGTVSGVEKEGELRDAHFFVLPTNYVNEGQPVSIIEALAHGCVVVSTPYRTIPEMLAATEEVGMLVPYASPADIARAVLGCVRDGARFRRLSEQAMLQYKRRFSRSAHLDALIAVILGASKEAL